MPREVVLANPGFLVTLDRRGWMRDLFYPNIGEMNHILGYPCRIGVKVDGHFRWLDETCSPKLGWVEGSPAVSHVVWRSVADGISISQTACIDPDRPVFSRVFSVHNTRESLVDVALFLHHDFRIAESDIGDTAIYYPPQKMLAHYKRDFWFGIGSYPDSPAIAEYSCGIKGFGDAEGTWRDAEDGHLAFTAIAQGSVDSTICLKSHCQPQSQCDFNIWLAAARSLEELEERAQFLNQQPPSTVRKAAERKFSTLVRKPVSDEKMKSAVDRALQVISCHCDSTGAILAANDTDIFETARAHYGYVWPRDGAIISAALNAAGLSQAGLDFINWCRPLISHDRPYFLQKYGPTGTIGASWHPWIYEGASVLPIQEDGTGLVLWTAGKLFLGRKERGAPQMDSRLYREFIKPMADFVCSYVDPQTHLPDQSWDVWEERRGVHAWTVGAVIGGLKAAAGLAGARGASADAKKYNSAASLMVEGLDKHFWDEELGRYVRTLYVSSEGYHRDHNPDSSIAGLFLFDAIDADYPRLRQTMDKVFEQLSVQTRIAGIARNRGDYYFRKTDHLDLVPGNPWIICTLWAARWAIRKGNLTEAKRWIYWAMERASRAGMLPEQVHPISGEPLAVQPLAWSHAELLLTILEYEAACEKSESASTE